jgi:hypothetical protein
LSPILLRPIREQFEHNRVIRLLRTRLRRRYMVGVNIEDERDAIGVRSGAGLVYPDLVLTSTTGARRLHGVVEVETAESVNNLEAMAEWVSFGKVRGAFYLYVPTGATDIARRLCEAHAIKITEIWSYHAIGDQMRFTMAHQSARAASRAAAAARQARGAGPHKAKAVKREPTRTARAGSPVSKTSKKATGTKRAATTFTRPSQAPKRMAKTVARKSQASKRGAKTSGRSAKTTETTTRTTATAAKKSAAKVRRPGAKAVKAAVPRQLRKKR